MSKHYLYPIELGEPTGVNPPDGSVFSYHSVDGRQHIKKSDGSILDTLYTGGSNGRILVQSDDELMINSPMSVSGNDVLLDAASDFSISDGGMLLLDDGSTTAASKVQWNTGNFIVHDAAADAMMVIQSDDGVMLRWDDPVGTDDVEIITQGDGLEIHMLNQAQAKVNFIDNLTGGGPWIGTLQNPALSADQTWTLPSGSGTLALTTDTIYETDGTLSGARTMTMAGNTLLMTGGTTISTQTSGGNTITMGTGTSPSGFGEFGSSTYLSTGSAFDLWGSYYMNGAFPSWQSYIYDNTTFTEQAGFYSSVADFSGTDRPYAGIYHIKPNGTDYTGLEANPFGTRILDYQNGLVRFSVMNGADGVAILSGVGGQGYIGAVDPTGLAGWLGTTLDQTLAEVLSTGNISGGTDIIMGADSIYFGTAPGTDPRIYSTGSDMRWSAAGSLYSLTWEAGSGSTQLRVHGNGGLNTGVMRLSVDGGTIYTTLDVSATANRQITFPDANGTVALLSDVTANDELSEILANGNTTNDGQTIDALNGGGQLNLRDGGDNVVTLTNDSGSQGDSGLYFSEEYFSLFGKGWSVALQGGGDGVIPTTTDWMQMYAGAAAVTLQSTHSSNFGRTPTWGITMGQTDGGAVTSGSLGASDDYGVIVGSSGSQLLTGIKNTVILGGQSINAGASNAVYVPEIRHFNPSIGGFDTVLAFTGGTGSQQTITFPNATGTVALLSDIAANNELSEILANGNITGGTDIVVSNNDNILLDDNGAGSGDSRVQWNADNYLVYDDQDDAVMLMVGNINGVELRSGTNGFAVGGGVADSFVMTTGNANIASLRFQNTSTNEGILTHLTLTDDRTWSLPNISGTIALLSDIAANNELSEILANGNVTGGNGIFFTTGDDLDMNGNTIQLSDEGGDIQAISTNAGNIIISSDAYQLQVTTDSGLYVQNGLTLQTGTQLAFVGAGTSQQRINMADASNFIRWSTAAGGPFNGDLSSTTLTDNRTWALPNASGTIALLSDIAANDELSEILANGNTTGANNILVSGGTYIGWQDSGFINRIITDTLTTNRTATLPDATGVMFLAPGYDSLVVNPTATEDGYLLKWDNTAGEYQLIDPTVGAGIYAGSGSTIGATTVTQGGAMEFDVNGNTVFRVTNTGAGATQHQVQSSAGNALIILNAVTATQDAYMAFQNGGTSEISIGWDDSANSFRMGTSSIDSGIFYEYNKTSGTGRHAASLGIGGTFPGTASRLAVRGIGTATNNILLLEDSVGVDRFSVRDNGDVLIGTTAPGFNAKVTLRGNGNTIGTRALRIDNSSGLTSFMVYDNRAVYSYGGYSAGTGAPDGTIGFFASQSAGHQYGFRSEVNATGADLYQFYSNINVTNTGFDNIGMFLDIEGGDNNWAVWTENGNITFGDTTPTTARNPKLQIQGNGADAATDNTLWKNSGGTQIAALNDGGQFKLGTGTAAASASIELGNTNRSLLLNRLTTTQENALTAVNGMIHYNSTLTAFRTRRNGNWRTVTNKFVQTYVGVPGGDTIVVNHNLNTTDVTVSVYNVTSGEHEIWDIQITNANTVTVTGNNAGTGDNYRVTIVG